MDNYCILNVCSRGGHMELVWMLLVVGILVQVSVGCSTMYLHRALTHHGVEFHPAVALGMHLYLRFFTGIDPKSWVAVHRKHHHFSDRTGDPHSPLLLGKWKVLFGNALYYRKAARDKALVRKYAHDYKPNFADKIPGSGSTSVVSLFIFFCMFGWGWGLVAWILHTVLYVLLNSMVNSLGHTTGYRNYNNEATNLRWLAWVTCGEGLHNNHHHAPSAAKFSHMNSEFDPSWPVICLLERMGLATLKKGSQHKAA